MKKCFSLIILGGGLFLGLEGETLPLPRVQPHKESPYVSNPNWQDMHAFPPKKKEEFPGMSPFLSQGDFWMLNQQAHQLRTEIRHAFEELHRSGITTGLYRKKLQEEYEQKSRRLQQIEARLKNAGSHMNPLNSVARFVGGFQSGPSSSLYEKK